MPSSAGNTFLSLVQLSSSQSSNIRTRKWKGQGRHHWNWQTLSKSKHTTQVLTVVPRFQPSCLSIISCVCLSNISCVPERQPTFVIERRCGCAAVWFSLDLMKRNLTNDMHMMIISEVWRKAFFQLQRMPMYKKCFHLYAYHNRSWL